MLTTLAYLIAIAVGREVFRPDSQVFVEQLIRIQSTFLFLLSLHSYWPMR